MAGVLHLFRHEGGELLSLDYRTLAILLMRQQCIRCSLPDLPIKVVLLQIRCR